MRRRDIREAIEHTQQALRTKLDKSHEDTCREVAALAFTDISEIVRWGPEGVVVRPSKDIPPEVRKAVKKLKMKRRTYHPRDGDPYSEVEVEVEMADKTRALDLYARLLTGYGLSPPGGAANARAFEPPQPQQQQGPVNVGIVLYLPAPQSHDEWSQQALKPSQTPGEDPPATTPKYPSTG
jgi:hypothetical protein